MTEDFTDTLSAFIDGEPIDPDRFAAALEDPGARAALVDFVRMRAAVRASDQPLPPRLASLAPIDSAQGAPSDGRGARGRPAPGRFLRWSAAAALLVLVFLAGLLAPRPWTRAAREASEAPPSPARIEKFTPGVDWHQSN